MAYLEGLMWKPGAGVVTETRSGAPFYGGDAAGYPEWKFRVQTKLAQANAVKPEQGPEKLAELASKITDGLTGESLKVAMDIGPDALASAEGCLLYTSDAADE